MMRRREVVMEARKVKMMGVERWEKEVAMGDWG